LTVDSLLFEQIIRISIYARKDYFLPGNAKTIPSHSTKKEGKVYFLRKGYFLKIHNRIDSTTEMTMHVVRGK